MSSNLQKFGRTYNSDWSEWVRLVKKAYKSQGHILTQTQAMALAKETYPGKGNVIGKPEPDIPIKKEIPPNATKRKKEPVPKEKPRVYKRDKEQAPRYGKVKSYEDKAKYHKREHYSSEESEEEKPVRRRREKTSRRSPKEYRRSPSPNRDKRRRKRYEEEDSDSEDETPPRRRKNRYSKY